jgi:glycerol-1-phosphate dehydrogenase [NAD(P)+]
MSHSNATSTLPDWPCPPKMSLREALDSAGETKVLCLAEHALAQTPGIFRQQFPGHTAVIVSDPPAFAAAGARVQAAMAAAGLAPNAPFLFTDPGLYAAHEFVDQLEAALRLHQAVPVAVGSGTINDLVKLAAHRVGRPYLSVATAASMDGYTAFGASITFRGAKQTFNCPAPQAVVADTNVIRRAPSPMTASGYADLLAKVTAGADWILADALGVEPIDSRAWTIVQGGLREALADPAGARAGEPAAIFALTEGLMLGGFAMQWSKSSRPASGAEHQFSHLWDMEHHVHNGEPPSHGFKVGLATLAITSLYEELLCQPVERLDVARCCSRWPAAAETEAGVRTLFAGEDFLDTAVDETLAKHCTRPELQQQLARLQAVWPVLRERLTAQLIPFAEIKQRLNLVGAPTTPEEIGLTRDRLRHSFRRAYHIRRRFTVLDVVIRTGLLDECLDRLFAQTGPWGSAT